MKARRLEKAHSIAELRQLARVSLPRMVFDYLDGASGAESTAKANRQALEQVRLVPSAPVDVANRSIRTRLLGLPAGMPVIIGPTGFNSVFWPRGDLALARAAARFEIPFVMSTGANVTMQTLQQASKGRNWFQIYLPLERARWNTLLEEARERDFEVLEVTVDTPIAGRRLRDLRNEFSLPFTWSVGKAAAFIRHPRWASGMLKNGIPRAAVMEAALARNGTGGADAPVILNQLNPSLCWDDLKRLRELWPRKLVVKGLTDPRQVLRAAEAGYDGIVVSNHGGRQLDGAVSTIEMLPEFVREAGGRIAILIDGGFRSGTDVLKALALGATAVQLGRATLYGLAAGGEAGVLRALTIIAEELDRGMALCGAPTPAKLAETQTRRIFPSQSQFVPRLATYR
jgi:(S)-mandelate dehydrogenase